MSTTQELLERLEALVARHFIGDDEKVVRAAAARLSELERENAELRRAVGMLEYISLITVLSPINSREREIHAIARTAAEDARAALAGSGDK